ncbi:MAG TPA: hypothetical protein VKY57_07925 [Chitinispirillaceae bacterium]|jgi:hypothetical protein|nr:hypothetical protein [Chitinispirillaceae bacterium]
MNRAKIILSFCAAFSLIYFAGCASISNFQTGKPLGKGNVEGMVAISKIDTRNGESLEINDSEIEIVPPEFTFFELQAMVGITEKLDLGVKYTFPTAGAVVAKYCLIGAGKEKGFFLSPGIRAGYTAFPHNEDDTTGNDRMEFFIPIHLSYYFADLFALSIAPTYSGRFFIEGSSYENCFGGSVNVKIGKKFGVFAEAAYSRNLYWNWDEFQFGGSVFFSLPNLFN